MLVFDLKTSQKYSKNHQIRIINLLSLNINWSNFKIWFAYIKENLNINLIVKI